MEKNSQNNYNDCKLREVLSKGLLNLHWDIAKSDVENSGFSVGEIKNLTIDIMAQVSEDNNYKLMNAIAKSVNNWKNDETLVWKSSLIEYARTHSEVVVVYAGRNYNGNEFIVVVNDVTDDSILEHNDFCFEIFDKYENIDNFMVLDAEEFSGMKDKYKEYRKIYRRG